MLKKISVTLVFVLAVSWAGLVHAEPNMKEGMWEISMKMDMKGMQFDMPPVKHSQCMTKKDLVPQKQEKGMDCKMLSNNISGDTVSWVMQCRDKSGTYDSDGKITYKGTSFVGDINMTMNDAKRGKSKVKQHMSGKRIGDCK